MGKDSCVLLWLIKKAFLSHMPIPAIHIDTIIKFPLLFKKKYSDEWKLNLIVHTNEDANFKMG